VQIPLRRDKIEICLGLFDRLWLEMSVALRESRWSAYMCAGRRMALDAHCASGPERSCEKRQGGQDRPASIRFSMCRRPAPQRDYPLATKQ
jgi:hypothetical protein